jgi:hypothetical protein
MTKIYALYSTRDGVSDMSGSLAITHFALKSI